MSRSRAPTRSHGSWRSLSRHAKYRPGRRRLYSQVTYRLERRTVGWRGQRQTSSYGSGKRAPRKNGRWCANALSLEHLEQRLHVADGHFDRLRVVEVEQVCVVVNRVGVPVLEEHLDVSDRELPVAVDVFVVTVTVEVI